MYGICIPFNMLLPGLHRRTISQKTDLLSDALLQPMLLTSISVQQNCTIMTVVY